MIEPVFVDTSGLYPVLDADDANHSIAAAAMERLLDELEASDTEVVTHGSVIVEAAALVQRRLGMPAAGVLLEISSH